MTDFDNNNTNVIVSIDGENPQADFNNDSILASEESQIEFNGTSNAVACGNQPTQNGILFSHLKNNWEIISQKLNQLDLLVTLIIRAIIFKNKIVIFNHKYHITGTENISIVTIAVITVLCNWYLHHAALGDTLECFLGAGQTVYS